MNEAMISHHGPGHLWLASLAARGMELGLARIHAVLERLGRPDHAYPAIVVAGTDGKGSTSAMITQLLDAADLRVGHYTSPHLVETRERVRVGPSCVTADALDEALVAVETACNAAPALDPTPFEALTAAALWLFAQEKIDVAVLEVGLGGRLDAVNATEPVVSVVTHLSHDHMAILGRTLVEIAFEKAAVARDKRVLVAAQPGLLKSALRKHRLFPELRAWGPGYDLEMATCALRGEDWRMSAVLTGPALTDPLDLDLALPGRHQVENSGLAVLAYQAFAAWWLEARGTPLPPVVEVAPTLADLDWPCRAEVIEQGPLVVLDAAHNPAATAVLADLLAERGRSWQVMLAVRKDRDPGDIVRALAPIAAGFWVPRMKGSTLLDADSLANAIDVAAPGAAVALSSSSRCLDQARREVGRDSGVVLTGSQHALGEWLQSGLVHSPRLARRLGLVA